MLFSSISFLYYFLPAVLLLYFAVPKPLKNGVLLLASLLFYGWGEPRYLYFMLFSILQGYAAGILMEKYRKRSKIFLTASLLCSLGLLAYCKYTDFFLRNINALTGLSLPLLNIALPIGISFYTFQMLSYIIDVYKARVPAQKNPVSLALYIAMFPQLVAGPIVRYAEIAPQLSGRRHSLTATAGGLRRFIFGLSKKVLIADTLAKLVQICKTTEEASVLFFWISAVAFMLEIYFDFSGYSDMAIGLGQIFGFHLPENFNYPYISCSITEFWRRWHISLGRWFRDYLYIPLGGNRAGKARWLLNLLLVWAATGLWHGASWNFVLWGLYFAALLVLEKLFLLPLLQKSKVISRLYVLLFVLFGFVLFDAANLREALSCFSSMFGGGQLPLVSASCLYYLKSYGLILLLAAAGATPWPKRLAENFKHTRWGEKVLVLAEPLCLTALLLTCTAWLIDGSFRPFLYFRF